MISIRTKKAEYGAYRALCRSRGVSSYEVSKATGVSQATLSHWKHGLYSPKVDKVQRVADFFGVPVTDFYEDG